MRKLALVFLLVGALAFSGMGIASAQFHPSGASCRSSAVRVEGKGPLSALKIEPFVANDKEFPCESDEAALINDEIVIPGVGTLGIVVLGAGTDGTFAPFVGIAGATPLLVTLRDTSGNVVAVVAVANAGALSVCTPFGNQFEAGSIVLAAFVGAPVNQGVLLPLQPVDIGIPGVVAVHLNSTTLSGNKIVQRAVWIETPLADVIVGEAVADCEVAAAG